MAYSPYAPPRDVPHGPGTYRPLGGKTIMASIAIVATVVLTLGLSILTTVKPMPTKPEEVDLVTLAVIGVAALVVQIVSLTAAVVFLLWMHRAATNVRGYGHEGLEFTPGWCIGWWFIPVAWWWKPYQALREIWMASDPSSVGGDTMAWRRSAVPSTLPLWWASYILNTVVAAIGAVWVSVAQMQKMDASLASVCTVLAQLFNIVAAVAIVSIMRQLDRRQTECAARCASAPATVVASTPSGSPRPGTGS